jgi:outer membrane lipoprotein-sorting protein
MNRRQGPIRGRFPKQEVKVHSMFHRSLSLSVLLALAISSVIGANTAPNPAGLSAAEIIDKNVAARGGLPAWRSVQTLSMTGKMDAGGNTRPTLAVPGAKAPLEAAKRPKAQVQLPFVMELKRPRKQRVELKFQGETAIQVYDGTDGWKLRPFLNRHEVEPYSAEEMKAAALQADLDGPLVDYAAKGTKVELEGAEKVEDRDTYRLKLTMKNGVVQHVWVDAQTYLEAKIEGAPRRLDGKYHRVETYFRDFRSVDGLKVPYVLETAVQGVPQRQKIEIDKVVVNPKLDDSLFAKLH